MKNQTPQFRCSQPVKMSNWIYTRITGMYWDTDCNSFYYYVQTDNRSYKEDFISKPTDFELWTYF